MYQHLLGQQPKGRPVFLFFFFLVFFHFLFFFGFTVWVAFLPPYSIYIFGFRLFDFLCVEVFILFNAAAIVPIAVLESEAMDQNLSLKIYGLKRTSRTYHDPPLIHFRGCDHFQLFIYLFIFCYLICHQEK